MHLGGHNGDIVQGRDTMWKLCHRGGVSLRERDGVTLKLVFVQFENALIRWKRPKRLPEWGARKCFHRALCGLVLDEPE